MPDLILAHRGTSIMPVGAVAAIHRWPVKGLGAEALEVVTLEAGRPVPFDRAWAIENGPSGFNSQAPQALPKTRLLMLMKDERLAALDTEFDEETRGLEIYRHGRRVAGGRLDEPLGRNLLEQFFAAYMADSLRGPPKILSAPGHSFSDAGKPVVSIVNLASVEDLERVAGRAVDPLRFRANIQLAGLDPWAELDLVGGTVRLGGAVLKVVERIARCAATNVDPATGARDMQIPRTLSGAFGHMDFGVYAEVVEGGTVRIGDRLV